MKRIAILTSLILISMVTVARGQSSFVPQKSLTGYCITPSLSWVKINTSSQSSGFTPQESSALYGLNGSTPAPLACDANGNLFAGSFTYGATLPATCSPPQVFSVVSGGTAVPYFCSAANTWQAFGTGTGAGTVTSVGLSLPADFTVSGSPVTGSGTLTAVWANENANVGLYGPASGSAAPPTWRALVTADLPNAAQNSVLAGPSTGSPAAPTYRALGAADIAAALAASPASSPAFVPTNTSAGPQEYYFNDFEVANALGTVAIGSAVSDTCAGVTAYLNINHPGQVAASSGTGASGTGVACFIGSGGSGQIHNLQDAISWLEETEVYVPVLPGTTASSYQFGTVSTGSTSTDPWTAGIGFYLSSANGTPNDWYCEYGTTYTDTTVAATAATWTRLTIKSDGTNVHWYLNGTQVCGTGVALTSMPNVAAQFPVWTATTKVLSTNVVMAVDYITLQRSVTR